MPSRRKIAIGSAATAALLLAVLLLLPYLFRDRIAAALMRELRQSVDARLAWSGVGVSLVRDFPRVTLTIDRPSIVGTGAFQGDTLLALRRLRLVLDAGSVVGHLRHGAPIVVRRVALTEPVARLLVREDGAANWDIVRPRGASPSDSARPVRVALRDLRIERGRVSLDDRQANLAASIAGLEQSLSGDFASDRFSLTVQARADSTSVEFAGIPYLRRAALALDATVDADTRTGRYAFRDVALRLNRLGVTFAGAVTRTVPAVAIDVTFAAPATAFSEILSLVPAIYARDFATLQTSGTMALSGQVRGSYGPGAFPAFAVRARVRDGAFRYPSLPLPATGITMQLAIDNPGGSADATVITLERLRAVIGGRPMDARLVMRTPVSDPDVEARVVGTLNLADLARTVHLEGVRQVSGLVTADAAMRARLSDVDARRYDRIAGQGTIGIARMTVQPDSSGGIRHAVAVDTAAIRLTPRAAELAVLRARAGRSDVHATGAIDNLLGYFLRDEPLRGRAAVASNRVDLNEWRSTDPATEVIPVPDGFDVAMRATAAHVAYGDLAMTNLRGDLRLRSRRVTLDSLRMEMLGGAVTATGHYETVSLARPTFDMSLGLAAIDIPAAFAALTTVQRLAPIARWAHGSVSGTAHLAGPVANDMTPVFAALSGSGTIATQGLSLRGAPIFEKVAEATGVDRIRNPSLGEVRAAFVIADGRVSVQPFGMTANGIAMTVSGSTGIDQTIAYDLGMGVPRALLGTAVSRVAAQARRAGVALPAGDVIQIGAKVRGTVTDPTVRPDFSAAGASVRAAAEVVVREQVAARTAEVRERVDSVADDARLRAQAEAARLVAEAERRAADIRTEARDAAERLRREAATRVDSLEARATSPAARIAARVTTERIKREADQQAERLVREADARADALVVEARRRAEAVAANPG